MPSIRTILLLTALFLLPLTHVFPATDIHFSGALVAEPCSIEAEDEIKELDFGSVTDKDIYHNNRLRSHPFSITLTGCSLDIARTVTITFSGKESSELVGYLSLNAESSAKGIAIGMETLTGLPVHFNKMTPIFPLETGKTLITLRAFIQGEPGAIRERTISNGYFNAIATFSLNYQ